MFSSRKPASELSALRRCKRRRTSASVPSSSADDTGNRLVMVRPEASARESVDQSGDHLQRLGVVQSPLPGGRAEVDGEPTVRAVLVLQRQESRSAAGSAGGPRRFGHSGRPPGLVLRTQPEQRRSLARPLAYADDVEVVTQRQLQQLDHRCPPSESARLAASGGSRLITTMPASSLSRP